MTLSSFKKYVYPEMQPVSLAALHSRCSRSIKLCLWANSLHSVALVHDAAVSLHACTRNMGACTFPGVFGHVSMAATFYFTHYTPLDSCSMT
jgi:hypothetical protein